MSKDWGRKKREAEQEQQGAREGPVQDPIGIPEGPNFLAARIFPQQATVHVAVHGTPLP